MIFRRTGFWRDVSPGGAVADLISEWRQPTPHRWPILGVSIAATFALMMLFLPEEQTAPPAKPVVTWITTFDPNRTDQQIVESNIENQKRQDILRAAEEARVERRREAYRALGRATGLDVDALEKQFREDEPAARNTAPNAAPAATPSAAPSSAPARTTGE